MLNDKKNNGFSLAPGNTKPSGSLIYRIIKRGFDVLFSAVLMIPVGILIVSPGFNTNATGAEKS